MNLIPAAEAADRQWGQQQFWKTPGKGAASTQTVLDQNPPCFNTESGLRLTEQQRRGWAQAESSLKQLDFNREAEGKENLDQLLPPIPFHVWDFTVHAEIGYAASSRYPRRISASLTDTHQQTPSSLTALVPSRAQRGVLAPLYQGCSF